ncbi:Inositol phosphatase SIW14 [Neurospora sp. IMI 360204]|nr:Inositol phosphatase SIW14 [Neurospora sp. IMI 360204]
MAPSLLYNPAKLPPSAALQLAQQAPVVLQGSLSASETVDQWATYENLLLSCLRTGDDEAAAKCMDRLEARFGADNERVMALRGLLSEAQAQNNGELEAVLKQYDAILEGNSTDIPITKRRIALLRSMGRVSDAASALVQLLDFSPTDAEAWSELSDLYFTQGLYSQAIYALEEVLLLSPNAWNIHARLGELQYMAATTSGNGGGSQQKYLAEALKRFARSIELCDDYLRGYYGLKLVTTRLLKEQAKQAKQTDDGEFTLPDPKTIERLDELATAKLSEIVRHSTLKDRGWRGYDDGEVAAARELLSQNGIER